MIPDAAGAEQDWIAVEPGTRLASVLDVEADAGWLVAIDGGLAMPLSGTLTLDRPGRTLVAVFRPGEPVRWHRIAVGDGMQGEAPPDAMLLVDRTPPSVELGVSGPSVSGPPLRLGPEARLVPQATDPAGVARVWLEVDGEPLEPDRLAELGSGKHRVTAFAQDNAGNSGVGGELSFVLDDAGPDIRWAVLSEAAGAGSGAYYEPPVRLQVSATDPAGVAEIVAEGEQLGADGTLETTASSVVFRARDGLGNEARITASWQFDRVAPRIALLFDGQAQDPLAVVRIPPGGRLVPQVEDPQSGLRSSAYRINGGEWKPIPEAVRFIDRGWYQVEFRAIDRAGNKAEAYWDVRTGKPRSVRPDNPGEIE